MPTLHNLPSTWRHRKSEEQCLAETRGETRPKNPQNRADFPIPNLLVVDADAARHWLQQQSYVAPDRISLLGWANGGVAALWSVRPRKPKKDDKPDFRSAVAFYPGCRRLRDTAWSARMPTLILIGAKDDWASAAACQQMVAGARGRTAQASITVYPGAYHDFDRPELPLQQRTGVLVNGSASRVHIGTDPAAREDALKRVAEWLAS